MKYPLILASKSPRRQELLRQAGFSFSVQSKDTDEGFPDNMPGEKVARFLAEKKAAAFSEESQDNLVLTADTTVLTDTHILNKPADAVEAAEMLRLLSGRSHRVVSGVCLLHQGKANSFDDSTEVYFRPLREDEIAFYIKNFQPFDKAGSYGIQEWIGMIGIEKIIGSYFTVMGLPVHKVYQHLQEFSLKK